MMNNEEMAKWIVDRFCDFHDTPCQLCNAEECRFDKNDVLTDAQRRICIKNVAEALRQAQIERDGKVECNMLVRG